MAFVPTIPDALYIGSTAVDRIYQGPERIWGEAAPTLASMIMDYNPMQFYLLDEASGDLMDSGSLPRPLTRANKGVYQEPIGSRGLVGHKGLSNTGPYNNGGQRLTDLSALTFLQFGFGDPDLFHTSGYAMGFGNWTQYGNRSLTNLRNLVKCDTVSDGQISLNIPGPVDLSGLWMRAVCTSNVESYVIDAGITEQGGSALKGTPYPMTGNPHKATGAWTYLFAQGSATGASCTLTHCAMIQELFTLDQVNDLWTQYQYEGV